MWILLRFVSMRLAMKNDCLKEKCVFYRPFAGITTACQGLRNVKNVSGTRAMEPQSADTGKVAGAC